MADSFLLLDPTEKKVLQNLLKKLPDEVQDIAVDDAIEYTINVLRAYPPYRYVSRISAYGKQWVNDDQRKAVMAKVREGKITPGKKNRNQELSKGWKQVGEGRKSFIANEVPHGPVVMGPNDQSRMAQMGGWPTTIKVVDDHAAKIERKLTASGEKAMKKLGAK